MRTHLTAEQRQLALRLRARGLSLSTRTTSGSIGLAPEAVSASFFS
jgi:hypothetical protein